MGDKQRDNNDFSKPRTISSIIVVLVGWLPWLSQEQTGRTSTCCVVRKRIVVKMRHACGGCGGSLSRSIYIFRSIRQFQPKRGRPHRWTRHTTLLLSNVLWATAFERCTCMSIPIHARGCTSSFQYLSVSRTFPGRSSGRRSSRSSIL